MPESPILSVLEAGQKERTVMRSLLNLAGVRNGGDTWQVQENPGGDVTIVDVDSEAGEALWSEMREQGFQPIALTRRREFAARHVLHKPLRSREFLNLLESVSSEDVPAPGEGPEPAAQAEWLSLEQSKDPDLATLAEHLRCQTWNSPVVIDYRDWPRLIIDPGSGSWFYDGSITDMKPQTFARPLPASAAKAVSSADLVAEVGQLVRRPLSELKWFAGLAQARGRLHPDLLGDVQFMLTQAPGEAMKHERYAQLARILIRAPLGIDELHSQSGETPENISAFLNACYTTGRLLVNRSAQAAGF